ncbi:hypothetical protein N7462_010750 [Penicillium macrosclerotiorum]|uniref:uncharacterized protein n=1 Tax=Penicillium macrosclerotiorum TaxID=303699 RepID=UPI0025486DFA|nr:uncharacterized protein N7462_010750 [Penicillium macrosclerotiorum]KAJ5669680.1 hypothetical protein N7462_010750 [Penicillium macrosclerotiorum]
MGDRVDPAIESDRLTEAPPAIQPRFPAPRVRLSCEACRQRKVKCDKQSPCTSCTRLGFVCVPVERARLPRGRTRKAPERAGSSDKELVDRVAKLEQLLKQVAAERDSRPQVEPPSYAAEANTERSLDNKMADVETWRDQHAQPGAGTTLTLTHRPRPATSYLGSSFWEDIMQQTQDLRTVLDDRLEYEEEEELKQPMGFGTSIISSETSESVSNSPQSYKGISYPLQTRRQLCEIYLKNVDPIFKILHRPSLRAFLCDGKPYLDYEPDHHAPNTLALAVYSAAVCTIDDAQCQLIFGSDKKTIAAELQRETEAALVNSEFVTTNELTVLQAYVLSLLAARCQDQSRRVWTMLAMALRVGQALCLHMPDPPFRVSPFEQQLRRRTWQAIGVLDLAASLDRASEPMMQSAWLDSHLPANINDEDIWFNMDVPFQKPPAGAFTDMTHTLIIASAQTVARSIGFTDFIEPSAKTWGARQQMLRDFERTVNSLLAGCKPDLSSYHLYVQQVASVIYGWLQLGSARPIQRSRSFTPPVVQNDVLLSLASDNLQKIISFRDPSMVSWSWFGSMWVPWHGLAVALAELCVCRDPEAISKHWPIVEQVYHHSSLLIADSQHGMLWKPLQKLMNQARAHKAQLEGRQAPADAIRALTSGAVCIDAAQEQLTQPNIITAPAAVIPPVTVPIAELFPSQTTTGYSLGMDNPTIAAAGQQINPTLPIAPSPFTLEAWPNVWSEMDFDTPGIQAATDDNAWLNYESFIGDVYDSVECVFLPRQG